MKAPEERTLSGVERTPGGGHSPPHVYWSEQRDAEAARKGGSQADKMRETKQTYAAAGVDISAADRAKELIKKHARSTMRPEVLSDIGFFGGFFEIKGYREPVLVSSTDGVGTKLKIASSPGQARYGGH